MIFVTVGTHEQQFNRLVQYMDEWAEKHEEEVVMQIGYSTYEPKYCKWQKFYSFQEMNKNVEEARIVITHGGPSSFIAPLRIGKVPIVVPRKKELDEHVNNHQITFSKAVEERMMNIKTVEDVNTLGEVIEKYEDIIASNGNGIKSNNDMFCKTLEKIIEDIL